MKLRNVCGWVLGAGLLAAYVGAGEAQTRPTTAQAAAAQQAGSQGRLDLSDPKVRERLRASGVDPDELQRLMNQSGSQPANGQAPYGTGTAGSNANGAPQNGYPPNGAANGMPRNGQPNQNAFPTDGTPLAPQQFPPVTPVPGRVPMFADSTYLQTQQLPVRPDSVDTTPKPFGYELFSLKPTTFEPLAFGPVSRDYLLGPGDEIIVSVWGAQEQNNRTVINRDGFVILPDVGQVPANGQTLGQFKDSLEKRLARIYSGVTRDGRGRTTVDVSLGKLRSIQAFVLGDVVQPGAYTLSATSSAMNGLYFAGGPTQKGSLRDIRVVRNNQVVHHVDLYDYLTRGQRSQDWKLENGDVLFVPPVQRQVTLEGEIRHPAIFELREGEQLSDLLEIAGGLTSSAMRSRVQIERIIPHEERQPLAQEDRKIIDVDLNGTGGATGLRDGDIIRVFRSRDILKNYVRLAGTAAYKPGTYQHRPGLTVADLVRDAGGLMGEAYTSWAHLVRTRDDKTRELMSFNLGEALKRNPEANLTLEPRDEVQVFSVWDVRDPESVAIEGLVRRPGTYDLMDGMTVTDLIVKAGGLQESAYRVRAEISRIDPGKVSESKTAEVLAVSMGDTLNTRSDASHFLLKKNDIVFIREIPNWALQENVWVTGEVKFPGMYSLSSKLERLTSVIGRAGGLEPTAYLQAATFVRKKDYTGRMAIDFEQALNTKARKVNKYDLVMAAGDSIHIPREPKTVKIIGEVGFPSSVLWEEGRSMSYYLDQAGGTLSTADKGKITVVMGSGRVERPGFMHKPKPDAGATIHVPVKPPEKERQSLKEFAQIISIVSGAATTIFLISRSGN